MAPVLAVAAIAFCPVDSQAQTNAAPGITAPGDKTYEQGEQITAFGITVSDADGDTVTVGVSGLPSGLSYASDQVSGTVAADATAQDYTVTISADDGVNAAVTATFTVTVTEPAPANAAPVITAPGDKTYGQGEQITAFGITVSDADGDTVTVGVSGLPSGLSYASDQVSGTVAADATAQDYTVTISADDGVNAAVTATFTVTVTEPASANAAPVITAPGDKTYGQGEQITAFGITVSDADGDTVTVGVSGLPSGLSYASGQVSGTVAADATAQDYTVTISADDGVNAAVTATFTVTVTEPASANAAPVITAPGDKTYEQGEQITAFGITVSDADGDTVTVGVSGLPSGLSYASDQVSGTVAADATAQDYTVTISADDGVNAAVTATFTVTVTEPASANAAPVITAPGDKTYEQGEQITAFGITVSDADGDTVTVGVSGLPSGLSYASDQVSGTVAADATAQDYTVTISADDGVNAAVTATFTVTVTEPASANAAPVITAPGDKTYEQGEQITAFGITVSDADGDTVTVGVSGLPSGLSYASDQVSGTVAADATAQDYTVTISADDGVNAAVTATFTVTVAPEQVRPQVTLSGPSDAQNGAFDVTITFSESVTGFEQGDVAVGNGAVTAFSGSGASYTATITPTATGTVTVDVAANVATDGDGDGNTAATRYSVEADLDGPTVTISGPSSVQAGAFTVDIEFSEPVTGFEQADVTVGNGRVTGWAETGGDALVIITPTATGTVTVDVAANVATDGDGDGNTAATRYSVEADLDGPTVTISGPTASQSGPFDVTITFSESVTGFEQADVTAGNGTVTALSGSGSSYTASITPAASGTATVDVAAGVAVDGVGNGNTAASRFSVQVSISRPTISMSSPGADSNTVWTHPFFVQVVFSELVTGFEKEDVTVTNGVVSRIDVGVDPKHYFLSITPAATGTVTVDVAANVAVDADGNGNMAASQFSVSVNLSRPTVLITAPTGVQTGPFDVTITFTESVTGFAQSDIVATRGSVTAFSGSGASYTATITPTNATGTVIVSVDENVAVDGEGNGNTSAVSVWVPVDSRPTVLITAPTGVQTGAFDVTITFTESVTGFAQSDIRVTGGSVTAFSGSGASYAATITPTTTKGNVLVDVGENVAVDGEGHGNAEAVAASVSVDRVVPTTPTLTRTPFDTPTSPALDVTWNAPAVSGVNITGYEARHRKSGGAWTTYVGALSASTTSFNLPGLEPGATYEAQVRALDDGVAGRWSSIGSGRANSPPADDPHPPQWPQLNVPWKEVYEKPLRGYHNDADGDPLTYSVESLDPGFIGASINGSSVFVRILNPGSSGIRITAYDPYGGANSNLTGFFVGVARETRSVPENSPAGTAVGQPVMGEPYDGVALSHWLGNIPGTGDTVTSDFVVDAATGQVRVKQGAALDYETKSSYTGYVFWGQVQGRNAVARLTINVTDADDDDAAPAVTIADASSAEGDSMTFTVRLDKAVSGGLTVTPSFTDGTAAKGTDYTENTSALSFAGTAGETQTFTVATTEDTDVEADETFTVDLSVSGTSATVTATDTATGTITNDDGALAAVTVTDGSAAEGDSITFTVTLDNAVSGGLTVTPSFTDVTATKGTDYTENTTALAFAGTAGETKSFTVSTAEDTEEEDAETFTVSLSVSGTSETVTATDTATGTIHSHLLKSSSDDAAVTIADASASEGDDITFTVTLDKAVSGGLTVTPSFTDGTATEGTDYTENTAALTFTGTANETRTFTVSTTEDTAVEASETFTVGLTVSGTTATVTATDTATGTITNDDGSAAVTVADESASEGETLTFTVTLDKAVSGGLTVTPSFTDVTATEGTDYTENTTALTFAGTAGETQTFTVATTEDSEAEPNETFTVSLAVSGTSAPVTATDTGTGTITNDDGALAAVTVADVSADEGDSLTFTVTLDKAVSGGLTVTPSFTDVTATEGADYTENTAGITFTGTSGETQTFTVATSEDAAVEPDETFTVGLAVSGTTAEVTATDTGTGTITNDDGSAAVTVADAAASEGETLTFTVTLDKAVSGGLTVTPSFTDGTATSGTDYTENTAALSFAGTAGETQTFTVATTEDSEAEPNETFTVSLTVSGTSAPVTATDTATGTITNDDGALAAVTVADASAAEGDSITFTVTLDKAVPGGLTVTPSFTDGTATSGTDYTENTAALSFAGTAGETQTFTVATSEDAAVEPDETFTVGLAVSGTTAEVTATDTGTGTITNDDGSAAVTVADASASEGETLTFTVTLDKAVSGGLTVTPDFTDVTATKGTDYTENTAALSFAGTAGETQTFTLATSEDTAVEPDETFTVGLAVSETKASVTATDTGTGTITDDDGSATVTVADASASEGETITFTVTLSQAVSGGLTVTPSFTDVTATKGTDYTENTAALSFAGTAGETQTFTVATSEDAAVEPDETFTVGLAVSETTASVTATDTGTGTITNDDGSATVTVADASASEGDSLTFTVTLDKAVSGGLTVTPGFTDGTAAKGTDYTENTSSLTFAGTKGETQTFTVATTEDSEAEPNETFTVSLTVSATSAPVTATDTGTGTITNDDGALAAVTVADAAAAEGDSLTFTVTLDKAVPGGLTVTPSFTDGTATSGTDYTENTAALSFAGTAGETQTFTVATSEDAAVEPDETFTVGLAVSGTTAEVTATDTATGTITNDDGSAAVTVADASASEGETLTFTVTLDKAVSGGLTVMPSFTDVTATEGTDYTENTAALSFAGTAGETQTFTVATSEDAAVEPDETFTVGLAVSGTTAEVTATETATGTITNDDGSAAVTVAHASASEGETLTFTVTLDKAVSGGLTVTPSFTDVTATEGTDYTENAAALSFAGTAGETQTFTVATSEDTAVEPDETFTVGLAVSETTASVTATDTGTGTITDDDGSATVTVADASASEGETITFTVTLSQAVSGGLTVTPSFTDVTATEGSDYTENTAALSFAGTAGETQTFTVATSEDTAVEPDETFTVGLAVSETTASVTATDTGTGTITDDDGSATVTVADASASEGDSLTFTVTLDKAVSGGLTVTPSFTDGTATSGTDYTANTAGLSFAGTAGETQTFTVATSEDTAVEPDEMFTVGLAVSETTASVTATDTGTGTITDDDGSATVTVADASASEGDSLTFTVTLDKAVSGGLTVTPGFTDVTATEGTDYTENAAALSFAGTAGETQTFTVATTEDSEAEPNETFTVSLAVSGTSATVTATDTGTGTITDDDAGGTGDAATVTIADASAAEGHAITFWVTLNQAVSGGLTVTPGFTDVTATEGTDYTGNTAALTFTGARGETRSLTVATTEDTDAESDETFTVSLNVSGTQATVTAADTATGTIMDDDAPSLAPEATLTIDDASAPEGDVLTFAVTLDGEVPGGFTATPELTEGTATSGEDYRAEPQSVRFAGSAGESHVFSIPTVDDAVEEGDETFTVSLVVSSTTAAVTATDTATGRIADDDLAQVALRVEPSRVSETAGPTVIEVTAAFEGGASSSKATAVHVTVGAASDAAVAGADYTASPASFTVTIPAGSAEASSTFSLDPVNDTLLETDEALTLSGTSESRPVTGTAVTLEDDDASSARLVVRLEPDVLPETAGPTPVTVLVEIVGATATAPLPVTMSVGDNDDTAQSTLDYELVDTFTVLIPAGASQESATFMLSPIEDDLIEGNETLTVTGEASRLEAASDQGTILDEDLAEVRVEGTGRTLFLLARAIGSEALAAIEERFTGAGLGRRGRLGRMPPLGPSAAAGWTGPFTGAAASFAGAGMPAAGRGMPAMAGAGPVGPADGSVGPFAGAGALGPGAPGMGMGMSMPVPQQPFDKLAWLDGASFAAPLGGGRDGAETPAGPAGDEAQWVVWGRAATTRTAVHATPGVQARGDLFTTHAGVDTRVGTRALLGVAVSHSQGKLGYTLGALSGAVPAAVEGGLTSVQPYVQWAPRPGLELWGLGGAGGGTLDVSDTFGSVRTGVGMRLAAGGVRQEVTAGGGLAVKADMFHAALASAAQMDLPAAQATATRARLLLEWESEWAASASMRIRPRLELGGRWDEGSDVGGLGSEVGGGISVVDVARGLELAGTGRYLLAHQAAGFEEWGASVALRAGPGVTRRGAWMSLEPEWGAAASRMNALWGPQADPGLHPGAAPGITGAEPGRLRLAAGYALPEAGADLRLEAMREAYDPRAEPGLRVGFSATLQW